MRHLVAPRDVIASLLYRLAKNGNPGFLDITQGTNALFGDSCCTTRPGFDPATGWGSPIANVVADSLEH